MQLTAQELWHWERCDFSGSRELKSTLAQCGDQVTKPSWTCSYKIRGFAQFSTLSLGTLFYSLYFCMRPFEQGMPWFTAVQCIVGHPGSIPVCGCIVICHYEIQNHLKHLFVTLVSLWLWLHLPLCFLVRWAVKVKQIIDRTGIVSFLTRQVTWGVHDWWTLYNFCTSSISEETLLLSISEPDFKLWQ